MNCKESVVSVIKNVISEVKHSSKMAPPDILRHKGFLAEKFP